MWLTNWLDFIGSGLVLAGLVWGGVSLLKIRSQLERQKATIRQLHDESTAARERRQEYDETANLRAARVPFTTYDDLLYIKQDTELAVVDHLRPQLAPAFVLATLGTLVAVLRAVLVVFGLAS